MFRKGVAVTAFVFGMTNSSNGAAATGLTVTGKCSTDGNTATSLTVSPVSDGLYRCYISAAQMNGEIIGLSFAAAGAVAVFFTIRTVSGQNNSELGS